MLGSTLDKQIQAYLMTTREAGGVVNSEVAIIAATMHIVQKQDSNLLAQNGGHIALTRDWVHSLANWKNGLR